MANKSRSATIHTWTAKSIPRFGPYLKGNTMFFRARNDYAAIDIADADFVLTTDNDSDQMVDQELPDEVLAAIGVLRAYAAKMESVVA